jgi:AcrR family transcriptional regulator
MGSAKSDGTTAGRGPAARYGRREQLLEVAVELFATKGYSETTMRDIADATGILAGSIYHHFASKEAMLDEILRGFLTDLHERFAAAERAGGDDPGETISELIRIAFSCIHDSPHAVAVYQNESAALQDQQSFAYIGDYTARIEQIWLRLLTEGQRTGLIRPELEMKIAYRFIRDAIWSAVRWYRPGGPLSLDTVAAQYRDLLYGGLF